MRVLRLVEVVALADETVRADDEIVALALKAGAAQAAEANVMRSSS